MLGVQPVQFLAQGKCTELDLLILLKIVDTDTKYSSDNMLHMQQVAVAEIAKGCN